MMGGIEPRQVGVGDTDDYISGVHQQKLRVIVASEHLFSSHGAKAGASLWGRKVSMMFISAGLTVCTSLTGGTLPAVYDAAGV